jgi:hypothetical protein
MRRGFLLAVTVLVVAAVGCPGGTPGGRSPASTATTSKGGSSPASTATTSEGGGGSSNSGAARWLGIPSVVLIVVQWVNEGTNWVLDKNQVSVSLVSDLRPGSTAGASVADFKIVVTNGTNTFDTVAKDVPCDGNGIPTDESVDTLRSAVEDIKAKIKRLQN